jgi:hypothetical protein
MDTLEYYGVTAVRLEVAGNGFILHFWAATEPDGNRDEVNLVFPTIDPALEVLKKLVDKR